MIESALNIREWGRRASVLLGEAAEARAVAVNLASGSAGPREKRSLNLVLSASAHMSASMKIDEAVGIIREIVGP